MADGDKRAGHDEDINRRLMRGIQEFGRAFPDHECLRCGATAFSVGYDRATFPVEQQDEYYEAIVLVCQRCGMTERHQLGPLRQSLTTGELPLKVTDE